jgi:hypothetical protein
MAEYGGDGGSHIKIEVGHERLILNFHHTLKLEAVRVWNVVASLGLIGNSLNSLYYGHVSCTPTNVPS